MVIDYTNASKTYDNTRDSDDDIIEIMSLLIITIYWILVVVLEIICSKYPKNINVIAME
jgi:hypothetical protein